MTIDYLKRILNARVYDVAQETPLEPARNLSARLGNRVLISVSGGVADYICDEGLDVEIFDHDNYNDDPDETGGVPAHFADLAEPSAIPVEGGASDLSDDDKKTRAVVQLHRALEMATQAGLLYEDAEYHNAVFIGKDEHGIVRHAHKRSVNSEGKAFRINVEGSDPAYSFFEENDLKIQPWMNYLSYMWITATVAYLLSAIAAVILSLIH